MKGLFILGPNHEVLEEPDVWSWAHWLETSSTRILATDSVGGVRVSTVFIGIDIMADIMGHPPRVFETMVFGGPMDREQERYSTWADALAGHAVMLGRVRKTAVN